MKVIKKDVPVTAFRLGADSPWERRLIDTGRIRCREDGTYEIFSREAVGTTGQHAQAGDYVKLDASGEPYPNEKSFFERNHWKIGEERYRQLPRQLTAWQVSEPICVEMRFLLGSGRLRIREDDENAYFSAELWGTTLTAPRDAVILFDEKTMDPNGAIADVRFRFVARDIFEKSYSVLSES